jgi:hypothetical protein
MQENNQIAMYPVVSAGCDYITCFGAKGRSSLALEHWSDRRCAEEKAAGRDVDSAAFLGFIGWKSEHAFCGRRHDGVMLTVSGNDAADAATEVIPLATNVSRLDLQFTVSNGSELPNLALIHRRELRCAARGLRKKPGGRLIMEDAGGETFYINRPSSDRRGRIYDWSSAHRVGKPRTFYRYEVQLRRLYAGVAASRFCTQESKSVWTFGVVTSFFTSKGVKPRGLLSTTELTALPAIFRDRKCSRAWLRDSVALVVAKEIKKHGTLAILEDLNLVDCLSEFQNRACHVQSGV